MKKHSAIIICSLIYLLLSFTPKPKLSIDGIWKIVEVQTVRPNSTASSVFPTESQAIFTHKYYSFCWTSHQATSRNWQMADSLKLARMNQSVINAGTYELTDSVLSTKACFAMNPMFVDGVATFKCSFHKDTLILTGTSVSSSEKIPHPAYAAGIYFVSKLIKINTKN